jgi:hypothetical protein
MLVMLDCFVQRKNMSIVCGYVFNSCHSYLKLSFRVFKLYLGDFFVRAVRVSVDFNIFIFCWKSVRLVLIL